MITKQQSDQLIAAANEVRQRAYSRYSNFPVGAAVFTADGRLFVGCNVENASYGLTICAERVAIANAVAAGSRQFAAIAVATSNGSSPCGACRQFLAEFCDDLQILLIAADHENQVEVVQLSDLLPRKFGGTDL